MTWSFKIGTFGGTEVRVHVTFALLLLWIWFVHYRIGGTPAAWEGVIFILAVFLCVVLHEFGHVLAARRYGIRTPDITLLPIGGLARLERMPREPRQELIVALAGPAVNVVIGLILLVFHGFIPLSEWKDQLLYGGFTGWLVVWNFVMVAFNMIPAFPMDGGRVLRAVLAMFLDYAPATRIAASIGQGVAVMGAMAALFVWGNILMAVIALFIFVSAGQE